MTKDTIPFRYDRSTNIMIFPKRKWLGRDSLTITYINDSLFGFTCKSEGNILSGGVRKNPDVEKCLYVFKPISEKSAKNLICELRKTTLRKSKGRIR